MSEGGSSRPKRVAERLRAELTEMLLDGEVHDPQAREAVITDVSMTPDLRQARIYVRILSTDGGPARQRALLAALERAKGFLRRGLAQRLDLRHTPELQFFWDETADRAARLEGLLAEIRDEKKGDGRS